ncbi:MAG: formylmethanofuran dehydrogenase subunit B [Planctomycetaceae bacterium]|nr:MAG: formylmethanofuran dehydrogenase subunit B [Planctomycetaceae bacterium]
MPEEHFETTTVCHVPCTACGCVCDDLAVSVRNNRVVALERACPIAEEWFATQSAIDRPVAQIEGQTVTLESAVAKAAQILSLADAPLVYGLSRSNTEGQRAAVLLAEMLGATIDTTASQCHGPSIMAIQEMGESTCSLGEIRNRADLVIYWGCHPAETHPRHAERYAVFPVGSRIKNGRSDRTVVLIGHAGLVEHWRLDRGGAMADLVVPIEPGSDFEVLTELLSLVRGWPTSDEPAPSCDHPNTAQRSRRAALESGVRSGTKDAAVEPRSAADSRELAKLARLMTTCQCGVVFFGLGLTGMVADRDPGNPMPGQHTVHLLLKLVAELNVHTRFFARRMRIYGDVTGADNVLCWHTGYPFSVNLARGYPRYNPGEFSADDLLARRDVDACLLVGSETYSLLSSESQSTLRQIPTIAIENPGTALPFEPTVRITTSPCGLSTGGTVYRMDGVPISLRAVVTSEYPEDAAVLKQIAAQVNG